MEFKELMQQHIAAVEEKLGANDAVVAGLKAEVFEIEQKMARPGWGGGTTFEPTWGSTFTQAKEMELAGMNRGDRVSLEFKAAITSSTAAADGSAGDLIVPERVQHVGLPQRRLTIRQLLTVAPARAGAIERPRQITHTTGAAMVAEGALKPQSDLRFGMETVPMRVIAHWVKASRQILDDAPQLQSLIDVELRYGLALKEEAQLLSGTGEGQDLTGMMTVATDFDTAALTALGVATPTAIDTIGAAIMQGSLTDIPPDGIVLHPSDWWRIRLTKDADGKYIMGEPGTVVAPSMFGLPVVPTQAQAAGSFLVGAFGSQTLYDRWVARVEVGFEGDDFTRNMLTMLGEERVGFNPEHPEALIKGEF